MQNILIIFLLIYYSERFITKDVKHTWEFPWVMTIEVNGADDVEIELLLLNHSPEIEVEQLLLGWVEPEAGEVQLGSASVHRSLPTNSAAVYQNLFAIGSVQDWIP